MDEAQIAARTSLRSYDELLEIVKERLGNDFMLELDYAVGAEKAEAGDEAILHHGRDILAAIEGRAPQWGVHRDSRLVAVVDGASEVAS